MCNSACACTEVLHVGFYGNMTDSMEIWRRGHVHVIFSFLSWGGKSKGHQPQKSDQSTHPEGSWDDGTLKGNVVDWSSISAHWQPSWYKSFPRLLLVRSNACNVVLFFRIHKNVYKPVPVKTNPVAKTCYQPARWNTAVYNIQRSKESSWGCL